MQTEGPLNPAQADCERVLRTLPRWFGIEESLLEYAANTARLPTFVLREGDRLMGFLSLEARFPASWELNCIAIDQACRGQGLGRQLHRAAEAWLVGQGAVLLQVKTLAATHPSPEYAETRRFYEALGYQPVEVFTELWGPDLPVLQLVKVLQPAPLC